MGCECTITQGATLRSLKTKYIRSNIAFLIISIALSFRNNATQLMHFVSRESRRYPLHFLFIAFRTRILSVLVPLCRHRHQYNTTRTNMPMLKKTTAATRPAAPSPDDLPEDLRWDELRELCEAEFAKFDLGGAPSAKSRGRAGPTTDAAVLSGASTAYSSPAEAGKPVTQSVWPAMSPFMRPTDQMGFESVPMLMSPSHTAGHNGIAPADQEISLQNNPENMAEYHGPLVYTELGFSVQC